MALADYYQCDVCHEKAFYDANIPWDNFYEWRLGQLAAICKDCAKTHQIVVVPRLQTSARGESDAG